MAKRKLRPISTLFVNPRRKRKRRKTKRRRSTARRRRSTAKRRRSNPKRKRRRRRTKRRRSTAKRRRSTAKRRRTNPKRKRRRTKRRRSRTRIIRNPGMVGSLVKMAKKVPLIGAPILAPALSVFPTAAMAAAVAVEPAIQLAPMAATSKIAQIPYIGFLFRNQAAYFATVGTAMAVLALKFAPGSAAAKKGWAIGFASAGAGAAYLAMRQSQMAGAPQQSVAGLGALAVRSGALGALAVKPMGALAVKPMGALAVKPGLGSLSGAYTVAPKHGYNQLPG